MNFLDQNNSPYYSQEALPVTNSVLDGFGDLGSFDGPNVSSTDTFDDENEYSKLSVVSSECEPENPSILTDLPSALSSITPSVPAFISAMQHNDLPAAQNQLRLGLDPNSRFNNNLTLLHEAIQLKNLEMARLLLSSGANPNALTVKRRMTPIMMAVQYGLVELFTDLVAAGGDPAAETKAGTALGIAQKLKNKAAQKEIGRLLGKDVPKEKPSVASIKDMINKGDVESIRKLLNDGLDANMAFSPNFTLLHQAISLKNVEIARLLLKAGANPNQLTTKKMLTPIMLSIQYGLLDFIPELVAAGADPALRTAAGTALEMARKQNQSALSILSPPSRPSPGTPVKFRPTPPPESIRAAIDGNDVAAVTKALASGLNPNLPYDDSMRILHRAISLKRLEIASLLVTAGADVNLCSEKRNMTPIMLAVQYGNLDFIPELVAAGANPALRTTAGTALEIAEKVHNAEAVTVLRKYVKPAPSKARQAELLSNYRQAFVLNNVKSVHKQLKAGLDPNSKFSKHSFLLHKAVFENRVEVVELLLKFGADPDILTDKRNYTPLMVAAGCGRPDLAKMLITAHAKPALRTKAGTALEIAQNYRHAAVIKVINGAL